MQAGIERRAGCPARGQDARDPSADGTSALQKRLPGEVFVAGQDARRAGKMPAIPVRTGRPRSKKGFQVKCS